MACEEKKIFSMVVFVGKIKIREKNLFVIERQIISSTETSLDPT